ncbi:hypothetical protein AB0H57_14310 [Micromonospora sp. NPDC050686]|uniref:hypothetical protein n=1 Tax=Micromonospora sp. NPDC050686 TaxID=3154631 RepID=UPI0034025C92
MWSIGDEALAGWPGGALAAVRATADAVVSPYAHQTRAALAGLPDGPARDALRDLCDLVLSGGRAALAG